MSDQFDGFARGKQPTFAIYTAFISELLPKTAKQMQHLTIVRSLCTKDNSHSAGVARIQRGDPKNRGVTYPYFGSAVARWLGPGDSGLPPYIWVKPGGGGFNNIISGAQSASVALP